MRLCWASLPPSGKARGCTHTAFDPELNRTCWEPQRPEVSRHLHFRFKDVLVNTIGHRAAEHALQLGLLFQPTEALQVGMVDQVVPEDQVQSTALSVMTEWLAIPGEELEGNGQLQVFIGKGIFLLSLMMHPSDTSSPT